MNEHIPIIEITKIIESFFLPKFFLVSFKSIKISITIIMYVTKKGLIPEAQTVGEKPIITLAEKAININTAAIIPVSIFSKLSSNPPVKHKRNPTMSNVGIYVLGCLNDSLVPVFKNHSFNLSLEKIALI